MPHSELLAWEESDRAKLVAHLIEEAQRCQMCGTADWEWADDQYAYEPVQELCRGCQMKENAADDAGSGNRGVRIVLVPKRVAKARREAPVRRPSRPGR
jgi:hypothetical protein